jgi:hypothetical protein
VEKDDSLPKKICSRCYNCLLNFYEFKNKVENVDNRLKIFLEQEIKKEPATSLVESAVEMKLDIDIDDDTNVNNEENYFDEVANVKQEQTNLMFNYCNICCKSFASETELNSHYESHKSESKIKLKCNICEKKFKKASKFESHIAKHKRQQYSCSFCSDTFTQT